MELATKYEEITEKLGSKGTNKTSSEEHLKKEKLLFIEMWVVLCGCIIG
jgi:hypothetical protein